jgi:hypothetical protein
VIISLIYLASQIKHGATAAKWAGAHAVMGTINELLMVLAADGETTRIWARGLVDFDSLDPIERVRFSSLMLSLTSSWDEAHHALSAGQIDQWGMQRFTGSMHEFALLPGFRSWYAVRRGWLSEDLRKRLDELVNRDPAESQFYALTRSGRV